MSEQTTAATQTKLSFSPHSHTHADLTAHNNEQQMTKNIHHHLLLMHMWTWIANAQNIAPPPLLSFPFFSPMPFFRLIIMMMVTSSAGGSLLQLCACVCLCECDEQPPSCVIPWTASSSVAHRWREEFATVTKEWPSIQRTRERASIWTSARTGVTVTSCARTQPAVTSAHVLPATHSFLRDTAKPTTVSPVFLFLF